MSRGRGRPRSYDPGEALDAAMAVFLARGYAGTTLDALSEATGMQRPSLYAAFGDKSALFSKALERFQQRMARAIAASLDESSLEDGLVEMLLRVIDIYAPTRTEAHGCFVFSVASLEAVENDSMRTVVRDTLGQMDAALQTRIERAVVAKELVAGTDALTLAQLVSSMVHSLSLRARAGTGRRSLRQFARNGVALLLRSARASSRG